MGKFKNRIRELREYHQYTQAQLADMMGVNKQTISQYERGVREPQFDNLVTPMISETRIESKFPGKPRFYAGFLIPIFGRVSTIFGNKNPYLRKVVATNVDTKLPIRFS